MLAPASKPSVNRRCFCIPAADGWSVRGIANEGTSGDCCGASFYKGLKTPVVIYNGFVKPSGGAKTSTGGSNPTLSASRRMSEF